MPFISSVAAKTSSLSLIRRAVDAIYPVVSGGVLTSDSTYYYRTFTSNGTLSVINFPINIEYAVIAGGRGGNISFIPTYANPPTVAAPGGNGSLVLMGSQNVSGPISIVVGSGGAGGVSSSTDTFSQLGSASEIFGVASRNGVNNTVDGGYAFGTQLSINQGIARVNTLFGASGAGASGKGVDATYNYTTKTGTAGNGGPGLLVWNQTYGGGGGAGGISFYVDGGASTAIIEKGLGGSGGGGNGGSITDFPTHAAVNSGGGGGGARPYRNNTPPEQGGNGGSGVVIVRYLKGDVGG
jgi:hypothetical protein